MKRALQGLMAIAAILSAPLTAGAADSPDWRFTVGCPSNWPGSDAPSEPFRGGDVWTEFTALLMPSGEEYPLGFARDVEIDCRYDDGKTSPRRHLTIVLPGRPAACRYNQISGQLSLTCESLMDADGTINAVRIQLSESVNLGTQLAGFRLRQTTASIRDQATATGFGIEESGQVMRLTRAAEKVEITMSVASGLSRLVTMLVPQNKWGTNPDTVMRFGVYRALHFDIAGEGDWERWDNPGQPVVVEYHPVRSKPGVPLPPGVRGKLMLIDTESPE